MKFKTTTRELKQGIPVLYLYSTGYETLNYLLNYIEPVAYSSGVYGWNYDVYKLSGGYYICTGYRGMKGHYIPYAITKQYNDEARKIILSDRTTDEKISEVNKLISEFTKAIKQDALKGSQWTI